RSSASGTVPTIRWSAVKPTISTGMAVAGSPGGAAGSRDPFVPGVTRVVPRVRVERSGLGCGALPAPAADRQVRQVDGEATALGEIGHQGPRVAGLELPPRAD